MPLHDPAVAELREEIALIARMCHERGLVAASGGNVSARLQGSELVYITPTGVSLRVVRPEEVALVTVAGEVVEGRPSKEVPFHTAVYRERSDVNAIVHVHAPYATAFAVLGRPLPMVTVTAQARLREVPVAELALSGTLKLAEQVTECLREHPYCTALLLQAHGVVTMGANLTMALYLAELVEETAITAAVAQLLGAHA